MRKSFLLIIFISCVVPDILAQHSLFIYSYWARYFQNTQYSMQITPLLMPGLSYENQLDIATNQGLQIGIDLHLQPVFSAFRYDINDPLLNVPQEMSFKEVHAGYFAEPLVLTSGLRASYFYRNPSKPHQFSLGFAVLRTHLTTQFGGFQLHSSPNNGVDPYIPFATFSQTHNFRPNSPVAFRLHADYRYYFSVFKQPFYVISRLEYQINNRPEVLFEVYNSQELLISSFKQHYPRFYGSIGLGWCWGTKK